MKEHKLTLSPGLNEKNIMYLRNTDQQEGFCHFITEKLFQY